MKIRKDISIQHKYIVKFVCVITSIFSGAVLFKVVYLQIIELSLLLPLLANMIYSKASRNTMVASFFNFFTAALVSAVIVISNPNSSTFSISKAAHYEQIYLFAVSTGIIFLVLGLRNSLPGTNNTKVLAYSSAALPLGYLSLIFAKGPATWLPLPFYEIFIIFGYMATSIYLVVFYKKLGLLINDTASVLSNIYAAGTGIIVIVATFLISGLSISVQAILGGASAVIILGFLGLSRVKVWLQLQITDTTHDALNYSKDLLTGLPNKSALISKLDSLIDSDLYSGVYVSDVAAFHRINESWGEAVGDELIKELGNILCKATDNYVARLDGDRFIISWSGDDLDDFDRLGQSILDLFSDPVKISVGNMPLTINLGGSHTGIYKNIPELSRIMNGELLVRDATIALRHSKSARNIGNMHIFTPKDHTDVFRSMLLEQDLRNSINNSELELYYQPIVMLKDGSACGFEALVRWNHPDYGIISPLEFIPIAESSGFIGELGTWVLESACAKLSDINYMRADYKFHMSVNVSPSQLSVNAKNGGILQVVARCLATNNIKPEQLWLEITEEICINPKVIESDILNKLRDLGVKLSIDDFGTGYSSFGYLDKIPASIIKIDRSIVAEMGPNSKAIFAIIAVAKSLGIDVVAEGVETAEQAIMLQNIGCSMGQGWLYGKAEAVITDSFIYAQVNTY